MCKTQCIYCQSDTYGTPCVFSPTNTHVHFGSSDKCIYCGSNSVGSGCSYNPYGNIHVKGPDFLNRSNIQTEKTLLLTYIFEQLIFENSYFPKSSLDRFWHRMSCIISNVSEPLLEALSLQETPIYATINKKQLIEAHEFKIKILNHLKILKEEIKTANLTLPSEIVEESILDAILSCNEN